MKGDTYIWQCYPIIGQTFKGDKKWLLLKIEIYGPSHFSFSKLVFSVDGDVIEFPAIDWDARVSFTDAGIQRTALQNQEALIARIARAREVWVTILESYRHSVKLSDQQLRIFQEILELYPSLEPRFAAASAPERPQHAVPKTPGNAPERPSSPPTTMAPAAPTSGLVAITFASNPPGAVVSFSGMAVCYTPCVSKLEPLRRHKVKMTLAGYADWTGEITVEAGKPATVVGELHQQ